MNINDFSEVDAIKGGSQNKDCAFIRVNYFLNWLKQMELGLLWENDISQSWIKMRIFPCHILVENSLAISSEECWMFEI